MYDWDFQDSLVGYVNSADGIYVTQDGGLSWTLADSGGSGLSSIVQITGPDEAIIFHNDVFRRTTDAGATWNTWGAAPNIAPDFTVRWFQYVGDSLAFMGIGEINFYNVELFRSTDNGMTWTSLGVEAEHVYEWGGWPISNQNYSYFIDIMTGYRTVYDLNSSESTVLETTNGGLSWDTLFAASLNDLHTFQRLPSGRIHWGYAWYTDSFGTTWVQQNSNNSDFQYHFQDNDYVVTGSGCQQLTTTIHLATLRYQTDPLSPFETISNSWICVAKIRAMSPQAIFVGSHDPWANSQSIVRLDQVALGIESATKSGFKLYPNPARNQIGIEFDAAWGTPAISVYDVHGRKVLHQARIFTQDKIELDELPNGTYQVVLETEQERLSRTLVIQH